MDQTPHASQALERLGISHKVFRHTGQVSSLEQAARERGQRPEQVVRSILFRLGEDQYLLALVAGPAQISWKKLRQYLGQSRLSMASEDEVLKVTGYQVGAVSPFGLLQEVRILMDPGIMREAEISIGSGIRGTAIILRTEDLQRAFSKVEVVELLEGK
jgi:Cys-tRNA(Pro) deacylase